MTSETHFASLLPTESQPTPPESPARVALAIKLLQTKPQSLSIKEYFALLRSHTVPGGRVLNNDSERRHIEACEFWRKRSEIEAEKVLELQARINELTEEATALAGANQPQKTSRGIEIVDQPQSEDPAKKKTKTSGKKIDIERNVKRTGNRGGVQKKPQPQKQQKELLGIGDIGIFDENFAPFSGSSISGLISSLRLLQFTREPNLVSQSITQTSRALSKFIQEFINGKLLVPTASAPLTRGIAAAQMKEPKEVTRFCEVVERSCLKVLSTLGSLAEKTWKEGDVIATKHSEFLVGGIHAVIKTLVEILSSIYINTKTLLFATIYPTPAKLHSEKSSVKDVRFELMVVLIKLLKQLNPTIDYQRNIIEGTFCYLLGIIGGALSRTLTGSLTNSNREAELLETLAIEEMSWYLLRILESILPIANFQLAAGDKKLSGMSREKLRGALIYGLFSTKLESEEMKGKRKRAGAEGEEFWETLGGSGLHGHGSIFESPFLSALWELLC